MTQFPMSSHPLAETEKGTLNPADLLLSPASGQPLKEDVLSSLQLSGHLDIPLTFFVLTAEEEPRLKYRYEKNL